MSQKAFIPPWKTLEYPPCSTGSLGLDAPGVAEEVALAEVEEQQGVLGAICAIRAPLVTSLNLLARSGNQVSSLSMDYLGKGESVEVGLVGEGVW